MRGRTAEPLAPLVKIPVRRFRKDGNKSPFFSAPFKRAQNGAYGRHHLFQKRFVFGKFVIFGDGKDKIQAERGNRHPHARGKAQFQQPVFTKPLRHQPQIRLRVQRIVKHKIAEEHLIAAVHGVKRLFAPRAVLVMLVHALSERVHGNVVNFPHRFIFELSPDPLYGIVHRADPRV